MLNKKLWFLDYLLSVILLILFLVCRDKRLLLFICFFSSISGLLSIYIQIKHEVMIKKDKEYRINFKDERNEKIRDKMNGAMCAVIMIINVFIAVIALIFKEYTSATLLFVMILAVPPLMVLLNRYYERKY